MNLKTSLYRISTSLIKLKNNNNNNNIYCYNNNNNNCNIKFSNYIFFSTKSINSNKTSTNTNTKYNTNTNKRNIMDDELNKSSTSTSHSKSNMEALGDRMKSYEDSMKIQVEKNKPFIIRLDGHSFSKFSKVFKPSGSGVAWDIRIHQAMIETSTALMKNFLPTIIYTFSDEITMCFPSIDESTLEEGDEIPNLAYSGKVQKLISLTAGLASTVFYKSITNASYDSEKDKNIIKLLENSTPSFDSRLFVLPSNDEIRNNLIWRSVVDCKRNSVSALGQAYFSPKEMHGLSGLEVKKKLLEKGIDYNSEPDWYKFGVYLKKQYFTHNSVSPLDQNKKVTSIRSRVVPFSFDITKLSNSNDFITLKTLGQDFKLEFYNPLSLSISTNSTNSINSNCSTNTL